LIKAVRWNFFGLQQVIKGWTEGIPYFKEGGSGVLLIPSSLGYGKHKRTNSRRFSTFLILN
jgi:FKBP-type peptidyl-prolyl cis-trans isomerase